MSNIVDMHMHLGFVNDPQVFACNLEKKDVVAFSNTVTPYEYLSINSQRKVSSNFRIGLGLHPWWIGNEELYPLEDALDLFISELNNTLFIGEIGLDYLPSHAETREAQIAAFSHIVSLCAKLGDRLISLHSVRAERELIDILESSACIKSCTCILHSYSGPSDQLKRAIDLGFFFSIGPRMLSTKRGREYSRVIPEDRLLLETDLPSRQGVQIEAQDVTASLDETLCNLAKIRAVSQHELAEKILLRSMYLLDF